MTSHMRAVDIWDRREIQKASLGVTADQWKPVRPKNRRTRPNLGRAGEPLLQLDGLRPI